MTKSRGALQRVMNHPLVSASKRPLRDALWRARGRGLANPSLPARVGSMLFVCKGNICRSPFAAMRASQILAELGVNGIAVTSAGLEVKGGARPPQEAAQAATSFGLSLQAHQPVQLTRELLIGHDITVVMEVDQMVFLRETQPDMSDRVFLLALLDERANGGYERFNVDDPFGLSAEAFERCYLRLDRLVRRLLTSLNAGSARTTGTIDANRGATRPADAPRGER